MVELVPHQMCVLAHHRTMVLCVKIQSVQVHVRMVEPVAHRMCAHVHRPIPVRHVPFQYVHQLVRMVEHVPVRIHGDNHYLKLDGDG